MKISDTIVKFLVLVLCVSASQAISLTFGKKQYLPPPIQELPIEDNNTQQQPTFEEKKYGNARYQIFEVHNRYEPSEFNGENENYPVLQKQSPKEIRIENINAPKGFPLDDPTLAASYLSLAAGNDENNKQIIVQHEIKTKIAKPFSSNYGHTSSEKSNQKNNVGAVQQSFSSEGQHQGQQHAVDTFKGPDYLPPKTQTQEYSSKPIKNSFVKQEYETSQQFEYKRNENRFKDLNNFPPQQHGLSNSQPNSAFKGSGYLPPLPLSDFRCPDFLPPHQHGSPYSPENGGVHNRLETHQHGSKSSDYLTPQPQIPGQSAFNDVGNLSPQRGKDFTPSVPLKGPDYLPPENSQSTEYKGPEYLPPHQQEQVVPIANIAFGSSEHSHPYHKYQLSNKPFRGPEYLPPVGNDVEQRQPQVESLPPGYDFEKPANAQQAIAELHKLPEESNTSANTPELSDLKDVFQSGHEFKKSENSQQKINLLSEKSITTNIEPHKVSGNSLPVYHFQKNLNKLHEVDSSKQQNLRNEDQQQSAKMQQFNGQLQLTLNSQSSQMESHVNLHHSEQQQLTAVKALNSSPQRAQQPLQQFKGPEYLPPRSQTYNGPGYLPPTASHKGPSSTVDSEEADIYLPPTTPTNKQILNPLSSYMNNVKPYDRYGDRMPFSEYGLPSSKATKHSLSNNLMPMYSEPAFTHQFYAPTMSYANTAFNRQTFSQHALQALQTFMPRDLRQSTPSLTSHYSAPAAASVPQTMSNAKIRTVQILNPTAVKTLKVLESLDNAGVKTIKILGPAQEQPIGDHRVVKVVSGSHEQSVQTVKIFNDRQDVKPNANDAKTFAKSNSYLPPRGKRNSNNKTKT